MKLNPEHVLERTSQILYRLKNGLPNPTFRHEDEPDPVLPVQSTQVQALCFAICEALNKDMPWSCSFCGRFSEWKYLQRFGQDMICKKCLKDSQIKNETKTKSKKGK